MLTQQPDFKTARKYWNKLKERLTKEGSQLVTTCHQLKMAAGDGKQRLMSEAELIFTAPAELSTRQIAVSMSAPGMVENKAAAKTGGSIAKKARLELEAKTGQKVVTRENYLPPPPAPKKLQ